MKQKQLLPRGYRLKIQRAWKLYFRRLLNQFMPLIILFSFGTNTTLHAQQESQYTQYFYNQQYYNPAYSGIKKAPMLYALHRQQWVGYPGAPQSTLIGFNGPFLNQRTGMGLLLSRHAIGIANSWMGSLSYAYELPINEEIFVRLGIQGSMKQLEIDFSDPSVIALEDNDPIVTAGSRSTHFLTNWGTGFYFVHPRFFVGGSVPNFRANEIKIGQKAGRASISKEFTHFYLISGFSLPVQEKLTFQPSFLLKFVQNAPMDVDFSLRLNIKNSLVTGVSYRFGGNRTGESIDFSLLYLLKQLEIGLAYDYLISPLTNASSGSVEMLIRNTFRVEKIDFDYSKFQLQF